MGILAGFDLERRLEEVIGGGGLLMLFIPLDDSGLGHSLQHWSRHEYLPLTPSLFKPFVILTSACGCHSLPYHSTHTSGSIPRTTPSHLAYSPPPPHSLYLRL